MNYELKSSAPYHRESEVWAAKYETAESLCSRYFEGTFRLKGGTVIWEAISFPANTLKVN